MSVAYTSSYIASNSGSCMLPTRHLCCYIRSRKGRMPIYVHDTAEREWTGHSQTLVRSQVWQPRTLASHAICTATRSLIAAVAERTTLARQSIMLLLLVLRRRRRRPHTLHISTRRAGTCCDRHCYPFSRQ